MANLEPELQAAFLTRLTDATQARQITWSQADARPFWFYAENDPFSYVIESSDADDAPPFDFHVYKREGGEIREIDVWRWDRNGDGQVNDHLFALYSRARGQALGLDTLAADLFSALSQLDGGSSEPQSVALQSAIDQQEGETAPF